MWGATHEVSSSDGSEHSTEIAVEQAELAMNQLKVSDLYEYQLQGYDEVALTGEGGKPIPAINFTLSKEQSVEYNKLSTGDADQVSERMLHYASQNNRSNEQLDQVISKNNIHEVFWSDEGIIYNIEQDGKAIEGDFLPYGVPSDYVEQKVTDVTYGVDLEDYPDGEYTISLESALKTPYVIANDGSRIDRTDDSKNGFVREEIAVIDVSLKAGQITDSGQQTQ